MKALICTSVVLGAVWTLHAQEPSPTATLPPGPLLNKAPDFSQWTVTIKREGGKNADEPEESEEKSGQRGASAALERIGVVQTGKIRHEVHVVGAKVVSDTWFLDGAAVSIDPITKVATVSGGGGGSGGADFPDVDWVSQKNFSGVQTVGKTQCIVFSDRLKTGGKDDSTVDAVAYIDLETRLPVLMKKDNIYTYQFGARPSAMQVPPADVTEALERYRKRLQRAAATPIP